MAVKLKNIIRYLYFGTSAKISKAGKYVTQTVDFIYLRYYGVETSFGFVKLLGFPIIKRVAGSRIVIGKNVTIVSSIKYNVAGINHKTVLATLSSSAYIEIGEGSGASGSVLCAYSSIIVGKNVGLGANSKVYDTDFHPVNPVERLNQKSISDAKSAAVTIGDSVWIGEGSLVLKGVSIGYGAVVGARAVVMSDVESLNLVTGNPATVRRQIKLKVND